MPDSINLADEFEAPVKVAAPTATTNESVDLMAEFEPPPRQEQYAVINDAADKIRLWKRAFDPNVPKEQQTEAAKAAFSRMIDGFGDYSLTENTATLKKNWEDANTPLLELPLVPEGGAVPLPGGGVTNHPILTGAYNGVAPIASSLTSPLNLATLGTFGALNKLAQGFGPAAESAKVASRLIQAWFAAQMAEGTGTAAGEVVESEGKSTQQKTADIVGLLASGAFTVLAAHGAAKTPEPAVKGKAENPKAVEEALANAPEKVVATPVEAVTETAKPVTAPVEPVNIGPRDETVSTGTGVPTPKEEVMLAEQKRLVDEHLAKQPKLDDEFTIPAPETPEAVAITEELARPKLENEVEAKSPTAVMNAVVDSERVKRGLEPAMETEARSDPAAWDSALNRLDESPEAASTLVDDLIKEPRAINDVETALIRHRQITLQNQFDKVADAIIKANEAGDTTELARLTPERDRLSDDLVDVYDAGKLAGTETGRGLRARRVMQNEDFLLARMVTTRRAINDGRALTPEQFAEVETLHAKIAETQKAFDEYVAKAEERFKGLEKKRAGTSNTDKNVVTRYIAEKATAARERIKARQLEGRVQSGLDPADLADHAIVGAEYIAKGAAKFADWSAEMVKEFGERVRPHLQAIFDKATEEVKAAQSQETRLKSFKTRTSTRIEDLERRVEEGDFTRRQKIALAKDAEANALQAKLDAAKDAYAAALERDRYNNLSTLQKAKEQALGFYDTARILMTTGEFSFLLRQGKVAALSRPLMTAKTLPTAFRALLASPEAAHAINLEVLNHPDYPAAKAAKLHLLEKGQSLNKQEEILMAAQLAEKLPGVGRVIRGFNQAAEAFLNKLRFDMFRAMRDVGGLTAAQDRQVAQFVNQATGRGGLGKLEPAAVVLGRTMFSPRYFASRLQLLVGHSLWGGDAVTRRIIAKEYARALIGLGVYYSALKLSLGDDDKHKATIGTDPRSSDFGKVKIGNTRLDPLAGLAQLIVFSARMASGEKKTTKGQVVPIRGKHVPYGGDKATDVAANFARSKLHPVPGAIANLFDGTDLAGNPADITNQAANLSAPLTYMDIYQALQEQDLPDGVELALLAMLGEGLQTYGKKKPKAAPIKASPEVPPASQPPN